MIFQQQLPPQYGAFHLPGMQRPPRATTAVALAARAARVALVALVAPAVPVSFAFDFVRPVVVAVFAAAVAADDLGEAAV